MFNNPQEQTESLAIFFKLMEGSDEKVTKAIHGYAKFLGDKELPPEIKEYSLTFLNEFGKIADKDSTEREAAMRVIPPVYKVFKEHQNSNQIVRGLKVLAKLSEVLIEVVEEGELQK